jgi:hypothetical protein
MTSAQVNSTHAELHQQVKSFGFGSIRGFIIPSLLRRLQEEAGAALRSARHAASDEGLRYSARINSLQPHAAEFLSSPEMVELLRDLFGIDVVLTAGRSCTTYYSEGDYLGPHLDTPAEECVVTIIVYLNAEKSDALHSDTGLVLNIYGPSYPHDDGIKLRIPTQPGTIVLGYGSTIWHERPRLQSGEHVIALTGCYGVGMSSKHALEQDERAAE